MALHGGYGGELALGIDDDHGAPVERLAEQVHHQKSSALARAIRPEQKRMAFALVDDLSAGLAPSRQTGRQVDLELG